MIALFDRWERVWHSGQFDLVPSCVGEHYIRHDESGDRTVTRAAFPARATNRAILPILWRTLLLPRPLLRLAIRSGRCLAWAWFQRVSVRRWFSGVEGGRADN